MPNTTIAKFTNTVEPDETAHNELSHLDLQCLPSNLWFFNIIQFLLNFRNFADVILSSAFFFALRVKTVNKAVSVLRSTILDPEYSVFMCVR